MKKRYGMVLMMGVVAAFLLSACSPKLEKYTRTSFDMFDTMTVIIGYDTEEEAFAEKAETLFAELKKYHQLYDIYHNYDGINNLKTINDNAGKAPVPVDEEIIDMLEYAVEMYEITGGKTNIAMGSVLRIWHDHRTWASDDPSQASLPTREELEEAATHTNIKDLVIDREAGTVYLVDPEMRLDVGAVAKGYATDRLADLALENGWNHMILSVGGNIKALGPKGDGSAWQTGIQTPDSSWESSYFCSLELTDQSLVTSGSYQRYFVVDDKAYHHIINPDTLWPEDNFVSVSIICESSALGDVLSTALFNMSQEEGQKLIESLEGTEAVWLFDTREYVYTSGLEHILE